MQDVPLTQLLNAIRTGDPGAADRLLQGVYTELHQIARREFRRDHRGSERDRNHGTVSPIGIRTCRRSK
jgi:hypothetical protein